MYDPAPPPAVTVTAPLLPPLHDTFVAVPIVAVNTDGSVIVTDAEAVQLFASVTVTV